VNWDGKILYTLCGTVTRGRGKGHTVGMPTANLALSPGQPLPPSGVYATLVRLDAATYPGATNVGTRPSVDNDREVTVETYLIGYSGDLYGKTLTVDFCGYLRPVCTFPSLEAVKEQVRLDIAQVEGFFRGAIPERWTEEERR